MGQPLYSLRAFEIINISTMALWGPWVEIFLNGFEVSPFGGALRVPVSGIDVVHHRGRRGGTLYSGVGRGL
jgi:hypothetical protein